MLKIKNLAVTNQFLPLAFDMAIDCRYGVDRFNCPAVNGFGIFCSFSTLFLLRATIIVEVTANFTMFSDSVSRRLLKGESPVFMKICQPVLVNFWLEFLRCHFVQNFLELLVQRINQNILSSVKKSLKLLVS